ncbi:MAG: UbiA family prenyltransferase [Acidobacteriota bacterium]
MESTLTQGAPVSKARAYVDLARPFTLLPPLLGFATAGLTSFGAHPTLRPSAAVLIPLVLGSLMAATLNAASNAINQIYDLEIDRVNKPKRPLPSGRLTIAEAWVFTVITYAIALVFAWLAKPPDVPRRECFVIVVIAAILTYVYSGPPLRTKRHWLTANVTIAIPRGLLLKVAGWSSIGTIMKLEPWYIGAIFGTFLLGAATTKDFADMKGDAAQGCVTLPIRFGVRKAAFMIAPFFVIPFLMIPVGAELHVLSGNRVLLHVMGLFLAAYGIYVSYLIVRNPDDLAATENHPSWTHMYRMMMVGQVGFALAYIVERWVR